MARSTKRFEFSSSDDPDATPDIRAVTSTINTEVDGQGRVDLEVGPNVERLLVSLGPEGDEKAVSPLRGSVQASLADPDGKPRDQAVHLGAYGSVIFVVENPRPGRWTLMFRYAANSSFVVRSVALTKDAVNRLQQAWPKMKCVGCKEGLQGAIAAAAFYIGGIIVGATAGQTLSVGGLAHMFRLPEWAIEHISKRVTDVSLDKLIAEVCVRMQLCPAE